MPTSLRGEGVGAWTANVMTRRMPAADSNFGRLIVFEGPDGVGKSRLVRVLANRLQSLRIRHRVLSFPGKSRGSLGLLVHQLHHAPAQHGIHTIHPASLQTLHVAAHIDNIERRIRPGLSRGTWIILDRYWWSTYVYGLADGIPREILRALVKVELLHWGLVRPDLIFLVKRHVPIGVDRRLADHARLLQLYTELASKEMKTSRIHIINNDGSIEKSKQQVYHAIADLLPSPGRTVSGGSGGSGNNWGKLSAASGAQSSKDTSSSALRNRSFAHSFSKLAPIVPTAVYGTFWRFAAERQSIFFKRLAGEEPPWSEDPILQRYRFTNAYRASDRASQFVIRSVIYAATGNVRDVFFRTILFKLFNRISTWKLLEDEVGYVSWESYSFDRYDAILTKELRSGRPVYSGAYIMPPGRRYVIKHRHHLRLLERMMADETYVKVVEAPSMQQVFETLRSYPGLGDFLAYQLAIDLNYSEITDFSEMEFVVPGPGARDGIAKCFQSLGGLTESDVIRDVAWRQSEEFNRMGLTFKTLWGRPLQLVDCQNLFCEVSKYARIAHPEFIGRGGRVRIKRTYRASSEPIDYWYPPKWDLNDSVQLTIRR